MHRSELVGCKSFVAPSHNLDKIPKFAASFSPRPSCIEATSVATTQGMRVDPGWHSVGASCATSLRSSLCLAEANHHSCIGLLSGPTYPVKGGGVNHCQCLTASTAGMAVPCLQGSCKATVSVFMSPFTAHIACDCLAALLCLDKRKKHPSWPSEPSCTQTVSGCCRGCHASLRHHSTLQSHGH